MKWARWFVGMLLLIPIQVWGISTSIIKTLAFDLGPEARAQLGFAPWGYNLIALAYQFGYLILPPVAPIAIWLGQFRDFLGTLNARKNPQPKPADR